MFDEAADYEVRNKIRQLFGIRSTPDWQLINTLQDQPRDEAEQHRLDTALHEILLGGEFNGAALEEKLYECFREEVARDLGLTQEEGHEDEVTLEINRRMSVEKFQFPPDWTVEKVCQALALKNMVRELESGTAMVTLTWETLANGVTLERMVEHLGLPDDAGKAVVQAYLEQRHENLRGADYPTLAQAELAPYYRRLGMPEGLDWSQIQSWFVFSNITGPIEWDGSSGRGPLNRLYLELMIYADSNPEKFA